MGGGGGVGGGGGAGVDTNDCGIKMETALEDSVSLWHAHLKSWHSG